MKRILATLLATAFVFSAFPLAAVAAPDPESRVPYQMTSGDVLDDKFVNPFVPIVVGREQNTLVIPIKDSAFPVSLKSNIGDDRTSLTLDDLELVFDPPQLANMFSPRHTARWYPDMDHAQFELAPQNIGIVQGQIRVYSRHYKQYSDPIDIDGMFIDPTINKDITELSGLNLAANGGSDTGLFQYNDPSGQVLLNGRDYSGNTLDDTHNKLKDMGTIRAGSELAFRLDSEHFTWRPDILDMVAAVRQSTLVHNDVGVYVQYYGGRTAIKEVVIENIKGRAYVIVRFRDDFPFLDEQDFELDLYLTHDKKKHEGTMVTIAGSLENDVIYVYNDDDVADISDGGLMVEAIEACRNVEMKIGSGVSLFLNMSGNQRYYARATDKRDPGDIEIMDYFPDIKKAYSITSVKHIPGDAKVKIDFIEYDAEGQEIDEKFKSVYYVYDSIGDLIGSSDEYLPLRSKYYLAATELNFDDGGFEVIYAGWADPTTNDNFNPGTGRIA